MSMEAYRWAKQQDGLSSAEKFVLIALADYYNDERGRRAWPSLKALAEFTALSVSSVSRSIRRLEGRGLVAVEPWVNDETGVHLNNRYCLPRFDSASRPQDVLPVRVIVEWGPDGEHIVEQVPNDLSVLGVQR